MSESKSKSKSGMNGHPRSPFDTIIEPVDSPMYQPGFYAFKPCNYGLQERLISKKAAPPQKKDGPQQKMFRTPKNHQARNHPILLLGSLGTQKTGSGLSVFSNIQGAPGRVEHDRARAAFTGGGARSCSMGPGGPGDPS